MGWTRRIRILWQAVFLALFLGLLAALPRGSPPALPSGPPPPADPLSAGSLAVARR